MKNYPSLPDALQDLKKRGYKESFQPTSFCLYCGDLDIRLDPVDFQVDEEYRFESEPDHEEEDIVLVAITAYNGVKGTLIDSYSAYTASRQTDAATK